MRGKTTALGPYEKGLAGIMTRHFFGHFIDELALEEGWQSGNAQK